MNTKELFKDFEASPRLEITRLAEVNTPRFEHSQTKSI